VVLLIKSRGFRSAPFLLEDIEGSSLYSLKILKFIFIFLNFGNDFIFCLVLMNYNELLPSIHQAN
jgi:hypothetical protein